MQSKSPQNSTSRNSGNIQLNIGCGPVQPEGWHNFDNSNRAILASRFSWLDNILVMLNVLSPTEYNPKVNPHDIRKGLPFSGGTVSAIYGGEMLEHLTRQEADAFLKECYRVLKSDGVLRIRVPDMYRFWKKYIAAFEASYEKPRLEWNSDHERFVHEFVQTICIRRPWLTSMGHFHKWFYDEISLILAFRGAGFREVERKKLHDSRIPNIDQVETCEDLIVEGIKL